VVSDETTLSEKGTGDLDSLVILITWSLWKQRGPECLATRRDRELQQAWPHAQIYEEWSLWKEARLKKIFKLGQVKKESEY
jgi:hypothetical protein